jgi:hypothetical protein
VAIDRLLVVLAVVAEAATARFACGRSLGRQERLEVVRDLMAQVSQDGPVGLTELMAARLALHRVGLVEVEGYHAVGVAGADRCLCAGEQVERQATLLLAPAHHGQAELREFEEQAAAVVVRRAGAGQRAARAVRPSVRQEAVAAGDPIVGTAPVRARHSDDPASVPVEAELLVAVQAV